MKTHAFAGKVKIKANQYDVNLRVTIHSQNYLYIGIDSQSGLSELSIFISPFVPQLLEKYGYKVEDGVEYQFSGNHIGYINSGNDSADGIWDSWKMNYILMQFQYFRNGICLKFIGATERGSSTWKGELDEKTLNSIEPLNFEIEFFAPISDLETFLEPEDTKVRQSDNNKKFIEQLKQSNFPNYG